MPKKNVRVRQALLHAGLKQGDLAKMLGVTEAHVSIMLRRELARAEQDELIEMIRGDAADRDTA